ncbi:AGAP008777-PA-like protein [Anopheles sinensis]|uniref:AGAP008777-PA-like protein n=1 Tax=Anopheles sinensis TaxID=74873 RepID=A0A084VMS3_ANOSI|nr:AGAP008777-PA-like protein [Anopheles sinensis]
MEGFLRATWLMEAHDTSRTGDKFETMSRNTGYTKYMSLKIRNVGPADFGSYRCVAKNSLGETDGLIKLDGNSALRSYILSPNCHTPLPFQRVKGLAFPGQRTVILPIADRVQETFECS